jgi:hypothetical protein
MGRLAVSDTDHRAARTPGADIAGELMRAAWRGDAATFDRLFDAWFAVLYAEAWRRTRNRAQAEELTRQLAIDRVCAAAERPLAQSLGRTSR